MIPHLGERSLQSSLVKASRTLPATPKACWSAAISSLEAISWFLPNQASHFFTFEGVEDLEGAGGDST